MYAGLRDISLSPQTVVFPWQFMLQNKSRFKFMGDDPSVNIIGQKIGRGYLGFALFRAGNIFRIYSGFPGTFHYF